MSFRPITKDEALAIHSAVVVRFGGIDGVRDEGLLESALAQPFQSFAGNDLYPTDGAKACRYVCGIIKDPVRRWQQTNRYRPHGHVPQVVRVRIQVIPCRAS